MTTATLPQTVLAKLGALRRRMMTWFLVDGLGRIAVAVVAMCLLSFGLDRLFRMDLAQRWIVLLIMVAVVGWLFWRRILNPLRRMPDDDALAIRVEARHRELGDALITSMQLARLQDPAAVGASPTLVADAIRRGAAAAESVPFDDVVDRDRRNRTAAAAAVALAAFGLIIALFPGMMNTWAQRNLLLSTTVTWPQQTRLQVVGADEQRMITVPRGDDFRLKVRVEDGYLVPDMVHIDYRTESGVRATEQMAHVGDRGFQATFRNVLEPFSFRVRGNDDRTERHEVVLVDRPMPDRLAVRVTPPAYTGEPTTPLTWVIPPTDEQNQTPATADTFHVLEGATLQISGRSNKPIAEAYLVRGPETLRPVPVGDDQHAFSFNIAPDELASGAFGIRMVDTHGLASRRPARFAVRVRPDAPPDVRVELQGIGEMITNVATIPLEMQFSDDFGVIDFGLVHSHTASIGAENPIEPSEPVWQPIERVVERLPVKRIEPIEHRFETAPLETPVGTHLSFHFAAVDNDAVGDADKPGRRLPPSDDAAPTGGETGDPYQAEVRKVGRSTAFSLKVVTPEVLRDELLRQEGEQRLEFDRLRDAQEDIRTEARALRAPLANARADGQPIEFTAERVGVLADLEKDQRLTARTCRAIRDRFEQIRLEYVNNKLEGASRRVTRRLTERVIEPLGELAEQMLPAAADQLDRARKTTLSPTDRLAALEEAIERQNAIAARMQTILAAMVKMEGFQAAINLAREILEAQKAVREMTAEEHRRRVEQALDELEKQFD